VELPITLDYLGNTTTNIAFVSLHGRLGLFLIDSDGVRAVGDNNYDQFGLGKDAIDYSCESFPCDRAKEESPIDVNIK
jgi:hypothetical protein